jgi:hypothetical protein
MDLRNALAGGLVGFAQNSLGIIIRPYETYRRINRQENIWELPFVAIILSLYFAIASLVKTEAFRPYLLTKQFVLLTGAAIISYAIATFIFYKSAKLVGGVGTLRRVAMGWGYTLYPTLIWFLSTSILYIFLPPPRTSSAAGMAFSVLYLVFSTTLFFWKAILLYLTLRFGMRLTLPRILLVLALSLPLLGIYSYGMYILGIFKIPFI